MCEVLWRVAGECVRGCVEGGRESCCPVTLCVCVCVWCVICVTNVMKR